MLCLVSYVHTIQCCDALGSGDNVMSKGKITEVALHFYEKFPDRAITAIYTNQPDTGMQHFHHAVTYQELTIS